MTRILSGAVLGGSIGAALVWGPPWLMLAIAVGVAVLACAEFAALAALADAPVPRASTSVASVALCAAVPWAPALVLPVVASVILAQAALAVAWLTPDGRTLARVATAVFVPLYIGLPLGSLVAVHWTEGWRAALLLIATVAVSDTAQYYGGRSMGRRPLAPMISPKKTVEGALTGLAAGTAAFAWLGHLLWPSLSWPALSGIGLAIVALGITGDLFESMLKRGVGAKDSSALIPGHGGVLDRIDALLFAAPVYYTILRFAVRGA